MLIPFYHQPDIRFYPRPFVFTILLCQFVVCRFRAIVRILVNGDWKMANITFAALIENKATMVIVLLFVPYPLSQGIVFVPFYIDECLTLYVCQRNNNSTMSRFK